MLHIPTAVLAIGTMLVAGGVGADDANTTLRVRSEHATITRLVAQATRQSATFRREIEAINATDGLVYVHDARCGGGVRACLMHTVELAGPYRLLRVKLDLRGSEFETMATLGHELQHVIEVLNDPHVRSNFSISAFYRRLAPTDSHQFETSAAFHAGLDVHDELISNARSRSSGSQKDMRRSGGDFDQVRINGRSSVRPTCTGHEAPGAAQPCVAFRSGQPPQ